MPGIDIAKLVGELQTATSRVLKKDVAHVKGFSQDQLRLISEQVQFIAEGVASGELTADEQKFFTARLNESIENYGNILNAMVWVEIDKLWNACVGVITGALSVAVGPSGGRMIGAALSVARAASGGAGR